ELYAILCGRLVEETQLGRIAIDQCNPLLRALGVTPLGFLKGLLDDVCHRLRQRGPYPFGFRPWSGRCGEVCWPQLTQDVGRGTHPWCNRIDGRHGGHPFGMVPFALGAPGAAWHSVGLCRRS